jgi:hypothetical protein
MLGFRDFRFRETEHGQKMPANHPGIERLKETSIRFFSIDSICKIKPKLLWLKGVPRANTVSVHRCIINESYAARASQIGRFGTFFLMLLIESLGINYCKDRV